MERSVKYTRPIYEEFVPKSFVPISALHKTRVKLPTLAETRDLRSELCVALGSFKANLYYHIQHQKKRYYLSKTPKKFLEPRASIYHAIF